MVVETLVGAYGERDNDFSPVLNNPGSYSVSKEIIQIVGGCTDNQSGRSTFDVRN